MNQPLEVGPQIHFDKNYLCMMADIRKIKHDQGKMKVSISFNFNFLFGYANDYLF
jgi:hypothetical protein